MLVKEIMTTNVKTIRPEDTVKKLAEEMVEYKIGALVVVSGSGEVVAILKQPKVNKFRLYFLLIHAYISSFLLKLRTKILKKPY